MTLSLALNVAQLGLSQAEQKIAVSASNISNANREGYTRKVLTSDFQSIGIVSVPFGGRSVRAFVDPLLTKQVNLQATSTAYQSSISDYMSRYSQDFGSTADGSHTLSSGLDDLLSSLQILEANPTDGSAKSKVISTAQTVASSLNQLTQSVQNERLRVNHDIALTVDSINLSLKKISDLNHQISTADAGGTSTGDLEDQRDIEVQNLSKLMGVQYFTDSTNQVQVYNLNGGMLVSNSDYASLSYAAIGTVAVSTVYPGGFQPINLAGMDVTTSITSGKLGALIKLRDSTLTGEQQKLDAFSAGMMQTINGALNKGAAYPPPNTITGTVPVTLGTAISATGTFRVAVTDQTGFVQAYSDINMASITTVGGLITALNAISGVNASLDATGNLVIDATSATSGIAMNPMTSSIGGVSATQYFGLNNLFVNTGATAGTLAVNPNLISNNSMLATATLSSGALTVGGRGLSNGDASAISALVDSFSNAQTFASAGNFGARTATLMAYAGAVIADAAVQASDAKSKLEASTTAFNYLSDTLNNAAGVNIDEETANLTVLQTNYQANAQVISTVKTLFDALIRAVS